MAGNSPSYNYLSKESITRNTFTTTPTTLGNWGDYVYKDAIEFEEMSD